MLGLIGCSTGCPEAGAGAVADEAASEPWSWHVQNTDILQYHPGIPARYSGPNSLSDAGEVRESVSLDLFVGARLWHGAEAHVDGLMWQGFGLSRTRGIDGFPNGEAFRLGTKVPNVNFAREFVRQTIGLGGEQEPVEGDTLSLAGRRDSERLTFTVGRMSAKDIFDNNAYANDPRTQFMNWALMANQAWDYPADSLGYETGFAAEWNQPGWALRQGLFQMPRVSNGTALDAHFLKAWGLVTELEWRYALGTHPGAARLLGYLNHAHMGRYQDAVDQPTRPADITTTRAYRSKYGFGLNLEQELAPNIGAFMRLGWSDGRTEAWTFSDVDHTATLGLSIQGAFWGRPLDTFGLAGVGNGISRVHQRFFEAGGTGVLAGDGALSYSWEKILETYYSIGISRHAQFTLDYQFIADPAFNRDRGPVSVAGARLHWSF